MRGMGTVFSFNFFFIMTCAGIGEGTKIWMSNKPMPLVVPCCGMPAPLESFFPPCCGQRMCGCVCLLEFGYIVLGCLGISIILGRYVFQNDQFC